MRHYHCTCERCDEKYTYIASTYRGPFRPAAQIKGDRDATRHHCGPCQRYVTRWKRRWWKVSTPIHNLKHRWLYWWRYTRTGKSHPDLIHCGPVTVKPFPKMDLSSIFFYEYKYGDKHETLANTEQVEKYSKMLGYKSFSGIDLKATFGGKKDDRHENKIGEGRSNKDLPSQVSGETRDGSKDESQKGKLP